ncbi:hypothetical protein [Phormidesmis priestleyi]|uniref:hypothetical protein n=1 Tax=Phormidesmis priestleyi TaxID=268141 RepID=UPI001E447FF0|nr:hypothetical protein [Phormidesmis priestleyi]
MIGQDWHVTNDGRCNAGNMMSQAEELTRPYRLYRFLTDLEDVLERLTDDQLRLKAIAPLVRQLLNSAEWLQILPLQPDPDTGWAVTMLYDEPFFP